MNLRLIKILLFIAGFVTAPVHAAAGGCRVERASAKDLSTLRLDDLDGRFAGLKSKLGKGLTVTILHDVDASESRSFSFGCRIFYDLWDETYGVTPLVGGVVATSRAEHVKDLERLPPACKDVRLPWRLSANDVVHVTSALDPVSKEQEEKTRRWLAEKGIASTGASFGRAALALVDLHHEDELSRDCVVGGAP